MEIIKYPSRENWSQFTLRPILQQEDLETIVTEIFLEVKTNGDKALSEYSERFDGFTTKDFKVSQTELEKAEKLVPEELKKAIQIAAKNIESFHTSQIDIAKKIETTKGVICWREARAINSVGLYIPAGSAPLFSTVLMLGIPAKIAGCKEIVICTPADRQGEINPVILYTAKTIGITEIYKVGGAQAIAAMTYGTESIPKVSKLFGPGNQYVMAGKMLAQKQGVAIDLPAGPSEVLVIADESGEASFIASDLLAQAEHGPDSQVILLSTSERLLTEVQIQLNLQLDELPRKEVTKLALENSRMLLLESITDCISFSNLYAPEHLILQVKDVETILPKIENAGSVFVGNYSCESAGDYASGTNHTLPTLGYANAYSGVSLDSFIKKITFQEISVTGIQNLGKTIEIMAEAEGLQAHKNAVSIRLKAIKESKEIQFKSDEQLR
jgi:histidinol dehydrogenase